MSLKILLSKFFILIFFVLRGQIDLDPLPRSIEDTLPTLTSPYQDFWNGYKLKGKVKSRVITAYKPRLINGEVDKGEYHSRYYDFHSRNGFEIKSINYYQSWMEHGKVLNLDKCSKQKLVYNPLKKGGIVDTSYQVEYWFNNSGYVNKILRLKEGDVFRTEIISTPDNSTDGLVFIKSVSYCPARNGNGGYRQVNANDTIYTYTFYNENYQPIKIIYLDTYKDTSSIETFTYLKNGETEICERYDGNLLLFTQRIEYKYDEKGNWISRILWHDGELDYYTEYQIEYYDD